MTTRAGVSTQTLIAADQSSLRSGRTHSGRLATVSEPQHVSCTSSLPALSSCPPSCASELEPSRPPDVSVDCEAARLQASNDDDGDSGSDGEPETQAARRSFSESVATPATSATGPVSSTDNPWDCSVPVPGSKKKNLIYPKAPFTWDQWTPEECKARFDFVTKELERLVYEHLRLLNFESRPTYCPRMVGTCPSDARPSVLVTCQEADFKKIRNLFRSRAEAPLCLGKQSTIPKFRSPFRQRRGIGEPTIPRLLLVYLRTRMPPVIRVALKEPLLAYLGHDGISCGGIIRYGERSATLGVALDVGDYRGTALLTVDHLFSSGEADEPPIVCEEESGLLDRSSSPMSVELEQTSSNGLWEDDDEYGDLEPDEQSEPTQLDPQVVPRTAPREAEPFPAKAQGTRETAQNAEEWDMVACSIQLTPSAAYLDWALTRPASTTSNIFLSRVNTIYPGGRGRGDVVLQTFQTQPTAHLAPVYVVSGIRGILDGEIIINPSYLPSFHRGESCEAWTVILDASYGRIVNGESGSVVVDRATNKVYGHVVGSDPLGHAYVVPLAHVLDQVKDRLKLEATPTFAVPGVVGASSKRPEEEKVSRTVSDTGEPERKMIDGTFADSWVNLTKESLCLSQGSQSSASYDERKYRQQSTTRVMGPTGDIDEDETLHIKGTTVLEADNTEMQRQTGADLDTASSTAASGIRWGVDSASHKRRDASIPRFEFNVKEGHPKQDAQEFNQPSGRTSCGEWSDWEWDHTRSSWFRFRPVAEGLTSRPQDNLVGLTAEHLYRPGHLEYDYMESPAAGQQEPSGNTDVLGDSLKNVALGSDHYQHPPYAQEDTDTFGTSVTSQVSDAIGVDNSALTHPHYPHAYIDPKGKGRLTSPEDGYMGYRHTPKSRRDKPSQTPSDNSLSRYLDEEPFYMKPVTSPWSEPVAESGAASTTLETHTEEAYESVSHSSTHALGLIESYDQDIISSDDVPGDQLHDVLVSQLNPYFTGDDLFSVAPSSRFRPGEIVKLVWVEPSGGGGSRNNDAITHGLHIEHSGRSFYQGLRRFIVVANDEGHCTCVPILTYERQGCTKRGVKPSKHGIVYEAGKMPRMIVGEPKLGFDPVRIHLYEMTERLVKESRVNYSKLTTIEHSFRVMFIGSVDPLDFRNIVVPAVDACWRMKTTRRPSQVGG